MTDLSSISFSIVLAALSILYLFYPQTIQRLVLRTYERQRLWQRINKNWQWWRSASCTTALRWMGAFFGVLAIGFQIAWSLHWIE
jgi:hypothetical protein